MVLVRRIRKRGANIVVEANAEVLFAPAGEVGRWTNRFSSRVRTFAAQAAPVDKRPRWAHYGKPLKVTFTASTVYQPGRMRVYSAIGSSAPHAYYVDQGTGVYNGGSPYKAKILPPWARQSPSLYEHTWKVPEGAVDRNGDKFLQFSEVAPVFIRGQKGQFFFDAGLKRGFQSMRMRSFQVPDEGQISAAFSALPHGLDSFAGNTPSTGAFIAQLEEWRAWRDEAWNAKRILGLGQVAHRTRTEFRTEKKLAMKTLSQQERKAARARESALRSKRWRQKNMSSTAPKKPKALTAAQKHDAAIQADRVRFINKLTSRYPSQRGFRVQNIQFKNGHWYATVIFPNGKIEEKRSATAL